MGGLLGNHLCLQLPLLQAVGWVPLTQHPPAWGAQAAGQPAPGPAPALLRGLLRLSGEMVSASTALPPPCPVLVPLAALPWQEGLQSASSSCILSMSLPAVIAAWQSLVCLLRSSAAAGLAAADTSLRGAGVALGL